DAERDVERGVSCGAVDIFRRADGVVRGPDREVHAAVYAKKAHQERLFAVGTLKDIHRGASQAVRYWTTTKQT
ncbi:unnamed protein product, partial [Pylaiella littoralis]